MSLVETKRIKSLDHRLANQIAAGEVVERPASVVKELLENAIDAGATRIEVDIERGGTRLLRVTDNGSGIVKDDLGLALSRHATSKIFSTKDLAAIRSLGFRGEALASIASVSRLCLTSRTEQSDLAWQAIAEGREMQVDIQPASAAAGTRIEVKDLFYNTPARQKFLRAEKTEFIHIEDVFKRHSLANPQIAFILKHNHKIVKRVPAVQNKIADIKQALKRIESICGKAFADHAVELICQHPAVNVHGWLGGIDFHRSESDLQFVFVNRRPVKDKMLNHAIRQSYQGLLPPGRMPTFVIFLEIDAAKIDVNVHPTKHEVRFDDQRMVHDLLVKAVRDCMTENSSSSSDIITLSQSPPQTENHFFQPLERPNLSPNSNSNSSSSSSSNKDYSFSTTKGNRTTGVGYSQVSYSSLGMDANERDNLANRNERFKGASEISVGNGENNTRNILCLGAGFWLAFFQAKAYVMDEKKMFINHLSALIQIETSQQNIQQDIQKNIQKNSANSKALLFPQAIPLDTSALEDFETLKVLQNLGFVFQPIGQHPIEQDPTNQDPTNQDPTNQDGVLLQQIPIWLNSLDTLKIFKFLPDWINDLADDVSTGLEQIYRSLQPLPVAMIDYLLSQQPPVLANAAVQQITAEKAKKLLDV